MKAHEQILKMIEEVSPDDTAKLDEIDAMVWCYLLKVTFHHMIADYEGDTAYRWSVTAKEAQAISQDALEYTRSRDALKAIRPEGYTIRDYHFLPCFGWKVSICGSADKAIDFTAKDLPTEELAELHAIIQAIAYERENQCTPT
jgi:hypothetical protein